MSIVYPDQFLGLPPCPPEQAEVVILPLPLEKTVSYGLGCATGPKAILDATCQIETFDEETLVDFEQAPKVHTAEPLPNAGAVEEYLAAAARLASGLRDKFVIALGGEHTVSYGVLTGLCADLSQVTVVQIDAHADLIDELDGRRWSHGTVMRRLWERGCRLIQIGVRSLSRSEYELITRDCPNFCGHPTSNAAEGRFQDDARENGTVPFDPETVGGDSSRRSNCAEKHRRLESPPTSSSASRITTFFAHSLADQWPCVLETLKNLSGDVYLTIDVDGLDPSVIPSTGTPQPDGLSWPQTMAILRAVASAPNARLVGADLVEFIASPHPPGCDLAAAKLLTKVVAYWAQKR